MQSLDRLMSAYPKHLWLELSAEAQAEAIAQTQNYSNDAARRNAFINYLCLNAFINWLQGEPDLQAAILVSPSRSDLPAIWEVANGFAIEFGQTRLVLIPSETTDLDELRVPQEWADIPSWAGEYYLAVQVKLEDDLCWMRVWGFTTHQKVKSAKYNSVNRTYSVNREDLIESLNVMWVAREACPEKKPAVESLPSLSEGEAEELLEELSEKTLYSPRLEVAFAKWAALLENPEWRQQLYRQRVERARDRGTPPLHQWFQSDRLEIVQAIRAAGWQQYEEVFSKAETAALAHRFKVSKSERSITWVKLVESGIASNYPIALVLNLKREADGKIWILPQVRPVGSLERLVCLPERLQLIVVDESGETFDRVESGSASNLIQLDEWFRDCPGAKFSLKIVAGETCIAEHFVI